MKLQFNLLPDVKQEYLKAQHTKRTIIASSIVASSIGFFILLLMLTNVYIINKKQLKDADKDIANYSRQLQSIPNLDKILTVQNQLKALSSLHQSKHISSRLYEFLPQLTPVKVSMGKVDVDFSTNTMQIQGTTDNHKSINTFIDTLKFTTYKLDGTDTGKKAFPYVLEKQFTLGEKNATYALEIQFDPALFSNQQKAALKVPSGLSTTRSVINDPSNPLFNGDTGQGAAKSNQGGGQ
jgi:Tfp pilus assembly protein PilN